MNLEEAINSDDIEIARLAAAILRKEKGKRYVVNLIRKHNKYEFKKGEGLVSKFKLWGVYNLLNQFNQWKMVNTPLLSMLELQKTTINVTENISTITFDSPYKIDENGTI